MAAKTSKKPGQADQRPVRGKPGKKPQGPFADKSRTMTTRITEGTRERLEQAARASGRSLSQEIERRLDRSFIADDYLNVFCRDHRTAEFVRGIQEIIALLEKHTGKSVWRDYETFLAFRAAVAGNLPRYRPERSEAFIARTKKCLAESEDAKNAWLEQWGGFFPKPGAPPRPLPKLVPGQMAAALGHAVEQVLYDSHMDALLEALERRVEKQQQEAA